MGVGKCCAAQNGNHQECRTFFTQRAQEKIECRGDEEVADDVADDAAACKFCLCAADCPQRSGDEEREDGNGYAIGGAVKQATRENKERECSKNIEHKEKQRRKGADNGNASDGKECGEHGVFADNEVRHGDRSTEVIVSIGKGGDFLRGIVW